MTTLTINAVPRQINADPQMPLLWILRDEFNLTGTKFGCGVGICGACTVLIDGAPARACVMPLAAAEGRQVITIEGVAATRWRVVQQAWIEHQVPQCGYCQSGMIMAAVGLLGDTPRPSPAQVRSAITNLCRCGTYQRVEKAVLHAAEALSGRP